MDAVTTLTSARSQRSGNDGAERELYREFVRLCHTTGSEQDLLVAFSDVIRQVLPATSIGCLKLSRATGTATISPLFVDESTEPWNDKSDQMLASCKASVQIHAVDAQRLLVPERAVISVPLAGSRNETIALGVAIQGHEFAEKATFILQLVAVCFGLWQSRQNEHGRSNAAQDAAALSELLHALFTVTDVNAASRGLVNELAGLTPGSEAVLAVVNGRTRRCHVAAVSGHEKFDVTSARLKQIESVLDEAVLRQETTRWPSTDSSELPGSLTHRQWFAESACCDMLTFVLRDSEDQTVGACLIHATDPNSLDRAARFCDASKTMLADLIGARRAREKAWYLAAISRLSTFAKKRSGRIALAAAVVTVLAMFVPMPHRIHCDCQLEPIVRRHVVAPFEGSLDEAIVKPGDIVRQGDVLARMDGRELRWKHAELSADRDQARKRRDAAQAAHRYAESQIASLEADRTELQLRVIKHRLENLLVRSPVAGIVTRGDLERAAGAPLTTGQDLFEVAPLDRMVVEVAVLDRDVTFVELDAPIEMRLNAFPASRESGAIRRVQPRSEIRNDENVFIAEAEFDNPDGKLRPGMEGRVKISAGRRTLGWLLLHRPWEQLTKRLRW